MQVFKFDVAGGKISRETTPTTAGAVHSDLSTDTAFVFVPGSGVLPLHSGAARPGKWRGRIIRVPSSSAVGFAWLRVNASFSAGVTVRIYGDGVLFYTTPVLMSNRPVRLPAGLRRGWEIEVESQDRVTSVAIASTTEELV
jgi:hypothetical protein